MRALKDEDFAPRDRRASSSEVANGRPLDDVLFEAFALTREASPRACSASATTTCS